MVDDVILKGASANFATATDEIADRHFQKVKVTFGADGTATDVSTSNRFPVTLGLTDTELRATAVPVALDSASLSALETVSVANFPASQAVTAASLPLPTGAATEARQLDLINTVFQDGGSVVVDNFPVTQAISAASLPLPTGAASETTLAALSSKLTASTGIPDNLASGLNVRPVGQDTWACSFSDSGSSVLSSDFNAPIVGTGVTYNQTSGILNVVAGTTANAEFLARSTRSWRGVLQFRYSMVASQRIANTNFALILADLIGEGLACTINSATSITVTKNAHGFTSANVGQFMFVGGIVGANGVPGRYAIASVTTNTITFTVAGWPASGSCTLSLFGHSHVKHIYTGTTATNVSVNTQRKGWADTDTTATINTTASPGHIMQAHIAGREIYWGDMLRASTLTPLLTVRASRYENMPDDNLDLYLFLWNYNGTSNPASSTTWSVSFISVEKYANLPVYVQGQELQGFAAPGPVLVTNTVTVSGTVTSTVTGGTVNPVVPATPYFVNSAASTNGALIITGTSGLQAFYATNEGASVAYVKLYNKATAPTVGTDVPEMIIPVPAAAAGVPGVATLPIGFSGFRFALGLGIAITRNAVFSDTTAVGAGEVKVKLSRTV